MAKKKKVDEPAKTPEFIELIAPHDCTLGARAVKQGDTIRCPDDIKPHELPAFKNAGWKPVEITMEGESCQTLQEG